MIDRAQPIQFRGRIERGKTDLRLSIYFGRNAYEWPLIKVFLIKN